MPERSAASRGVAPRLVLFSESVSRWSGPIQLPQDLGRRVPAAHPMYPSARVRVAGAEIEAGNRHAVPEVGEDRSEYQLAMPRVGAAPDVPPDQVGVHRLERIGRDYSAGQHARAEPRGKL